MRFIMSNLPVAVMVFTSGFVVMSVEMLGGRLLAPYFGSSVYVWGSLIFTFMVGLSLGYGFGGRLSVKYHGSRVLAIILAVAGLFVYLLEILAEPVLSIVFEYADDPRTGSLISALILYLAPTAAMGMVSPVAIRTTSSVVHEVGNHAGMLYLISTLGSALGTLITAFWLVAVFEVRTIIYMNAVALLAVSALGFCMIKWESSKHEAV